MNQWLYPRHSSIESARGALSRPSSVASNYSIYLDRIFVAFLIIVEHLFVHFGCYLRQCELKQLEQVAIKDQMACSESCGLVLEYVRYSETVSISEQVTNSETSPFISY